MDKKIVEIAYYLSKWGFTGLDFDRLHLLELVKGKMTLDLFQHVIWTMSKIRLCISGEVIATDIIHKVSEELKNQTITQVRTIVNNNLNILENE